VTLDIGDVDPDPVRQVAAWMDAAHQAGEPMPEAMTVATATPDGAPSARLVLLRGLDDGFVFFTDYDSAKGRQLDANPRAAAVLHWRAPEHRQVRAEGSVERVTDAESDSYWQTRPAGSRRSAVASHQSQVLADRAELEERVAEIALRYPVDADVPRPSRWGGYRITPERVELWQERPDRLHDRLLYRREGGGWLIERLSP
jgi:pyridoxamine 5'-phosphate oxidase